MAAKNTIDVIIGGKVLTLSGYESEEYLQQVGSYINHKINEVNHSEGFSHLSYDIQNMFIELNIADDYFKAKQQAEHLESEIDIKDNELYNLKHDLINSKLNCEETNKKLEDMKEEVNELQKNIVRLETELSEYKKQAGIKETENTNTVDTNSPDTNSPDNQTESDAEDNKSSNNNNNNNNSNKYNKRNNRNNKR